MALAPALAGALDPALFMEQAGMPPDQWQADVLRSRARRLLLLCSRQAGKSTVTAALATHTAIYQPGALTILAAPSQPQSQETFRKVTGTFRLSGTMHADAESLQRMELENGSRIVSLSGNPETARGYSAPRLLILDEAGDIKDELYHSLTPMLAGGGRLIAIGTPKGRRGWFWDAWENGGDIWERVKVTADQIPHRVPPDHLAAERATKPAWIIRQEYFCEFVDTNEAFFSSELVARALTREIEPLFPDFVW